MAKTYKDVINNKDWMDGFNNGYLAGLQVARNCIDNQIEFGTKHHIKGIEYRKGSDGSRD